MAFLHARRRERLGIAKALIISASVTPLRGAVGLTDRMLTATDPASGGDLGDARAALRSALSTSPESDGHRRTIEAFIDSHPDALYRTCLDGHLTASALVVHASEPLVLVMLHTKLGMWLQPGGHADGEGHLAAVALREAGEETGIDGLELLTPPVDVDVHAIPERPGEPAHLHLDVRFVVRAPDSAVVVGNHESQELRWVTLDELDALASDDSLRRLARVGLELARR